MALARQSQPQITTEQHFLAWWHEGEPNQAPVAAVLTGLAQMMGKDLSGALEGYEAVLSSMTKDQMIRACCLAAEDCTFFPAPAELRRLAGLQTSAQRARDEALKALRRVIEAQTAHGPLLRHNLGGEPDLEARDADGRVPLVTPRKPRIAPPTFCERTEAILVDLGMGKRSAGLLAVSVHLSLVDEDERKGWNAFELATAARESGRMEQRWTEAWTKGERQ